MGIGSIPTTSATGRQTVDPRAACLAVLVLAVGCAASPPLATEGAALSVTPEQARAEMSRLEGTRVLWGGVVVASTNREETTRLEILAYPLDRRQRPRTRAKSGPRFLAIHQGYLETADFAPGRSVTVTGPLAGIREGRVGEAPYTYPVVAVEDLHLWPVRERRRSPSRFQFGLGVLFGG